ncbi:MAG: sigma factor-like helix-turn-helix DNA-binding protein [Candidatus Dormibacteraceae bacterium]
MTQLKNHELPIAANDSWRTWLMTGARRLPSDRRRVRGSHMGLKKMLVEGMGTGGDKAHAWKNLSDAMVRQSVGDALRTLPAEEGQLVKLAYFGGLSNRQLASRFGTTESKVQRRLRQAVEKISAHVERGRSIGRRVVFGIAVWLSGRWLGDATHHAVQATAVLGAAAIIAAQPTPGVAHMFTGAAPAPPAAIGAMAQTTGSGGAPNARHSSPSAAAVSVSAPPATWPAIQVPAGVRLPAVPVSLPAIQVPAMLSLPPVRLPVVPPVAPIVAVKLRLAT